MGHDSAGGKVVEQENEEGKKQIKRQNLISTSHHTSCHFIDL